MTTQNFTLMDRWFAQLDQGIKDDAMTQQIAQHVEDHGGFSRLAHWIDIALPEPDHGLNVIGDIKTWIASLLPSDLTRELAVKVRGANLRGTFKPEQTLAFEIPDSPDWRFELHVQVDDETGAIELVGRLLSADSLAIAQHNLLPRAKLLTADGQEYEYPFDSAMKFTATDISANVYKVSLYVGGVQVTLGQIRLDDSGNDVLLTTLL